MIRPTLCRHGIKKYCVLPIATVGILMLLLPHHITYTSYNRRLLSRQIQVDTSKKTDRSRKC